MCELPIRKRAREREGVRRHATPAAGFFTVYIFIYLVYSSMGDMEMGILVLVKALVRDAPASHHTH